MSNSSKTSASRRCSQRSEPARDRSETRSSSRSARSSLTRSRSTGCRPTPGRTSSRLSRPPGGASWSLRESGPRSACVGHRARRDRAGCAVRGRFDLGSIGLRGARQYGGHHNRRHDARGRGVAGAVGNGAGDKPRAREGKKRDIAGAQGMGEGPSQVAGPSRPSALSLRAVPAGGRCPISLGCVSRLRRRSVPPGDRRESRLSSKATGGPSAGMASMGFALP
jgi:hypothetical protein